MKSGLEGRNNEQMPVDRLEMVGIVSMKSGLEGRNNLQTCVSKVGDIWCLNEVRPGRPEQSFGNAMASVGTLVSMKSGLEGRNNP